MSLSSLRSVRDQKDGNFSKRPPQARIKLCVQTNRRIEVVGIVPITSTSDLLGLVVHSAAFTFWIYYTCCFCGIKPMQAASLGMLARKPDRLCCPCLAWCLSTAEKDRKMQEERKSKVLPVLSSRGFRRNKVTQKNPSPSNHVTRQYSDMFHHPWWMINWRLLCTRQSGLPWLCSICCYSMK